MTSLAPNINKYWADLIVDELLRNQVTQFFVAPGSRSSPLVASIASRSEADSLIHFDERGTSFLALGYGNYCRRPAVWITTSGTAVANGLPAVVEASQACVPLLLLTADRPFESRDVGANQAIDQVKIFGDYVRLSVDLPAPDPEIPPEAVLTLIDQAVARTVATPAGPVHLNVPFREPLAPVPDEYAVDERRLTRWKSDDRPYTKYTHGSLHAVNNDLTEIEHAVAGARRGLFVLGGMPTRQAADDIVTLATSWGWPVIADVTSQARLGIRSDVVVAYPHFSTHLAPFDEPDVVLRFGSKVVSKHVNALLKEHTPDVLAIISDQVTRNDPDHCATNHILSSPSDFCALASDWLHDIESGWLNAWNRTRLLDPIFNRLTEDGAEISEPGVARRITQLVAHDHILYVASSMPIRDLDMFADESANACWVGANRGASGIDGTIASGVGAGLASGKRATILCGDLALLHDLNSLSLLNSRSDVVVVVNNDGGGIFSFLPIADHADLFEPWFGTPHGYSFESAARMFGLQYEQPGGMADFSRAYVRAAQSAGSTLIEVRTDRTANRQLHSDLELHIASALL